MHLALPSRGDFIKMVPGIYYKVATLSLANIDLVNNVITFSVNSISKTLFLQLSLHWSGNHEVLIVLKIVLFKCFKPGALE